MQLADYRIETLVVPCDPPISDSQTDDERFGVTYLELDADTGETGVGFGFVSPDLPAETVEERFASTFEDLRGESPFTLRGRLHRPRGGNHPGSRYGGFDRAVDLALWDLCGKHLGMPVYELMGGGDPRVPAYASGLHFSLDDAATRERYERYAAMGFDAAKVKVGYPTIDADVDRLELVRDAMGDPTLAVDANEAWSPKEAIRRARAYREAGFDLYWIEDPVLRDDVDGARRVADRVDTHVNTGEYVGFEGKRELLENAACDLLNLRTGMFSTSLEAASLAHAYAVPTHVGQVAGHLGVHLAAALPEHTLLEYWPRPWDGVTEGIEVDDGHLVAPDGPGHGVTLADGALDRYGRGAA